MSLFFLNGIIFDTKYKYLIAKKTVQNNYGIFLALILKRSVHKIRVFLDTLFLDQISMKIVLYRVQKSATKSMFSKK